MKAWKYPDWLYCDSCENDVPIERQSRSEVVHNNANDEDVEINYIAAVCPYCGKTLCERDYHLALLRVAKESKKTNEGESNA